ncbi:MAG: hypothetical protein ACT4QD_20845 [Acidobacteriota bacterium]
MSAISQNPLPSPTTDPLAAPILISPAELRWLTVGVWVGGVFILTLLPVLLIPRVGLALGIGASYLLFFLAWQPIQLIMQRRMGTPAALVRMIVLVAAAATLAYYLRELLLAMAAASSISHPA